jgi:hypothetical protein
MGGIGEPAVSESVGCEQIAELVVEAGLRNSEDGDECRADHDDAETDEDDAEAPAARQASAGPLQGEENGRLRKIGVLSGRKENQAYGGR